MNFLLKVLNLIFNNFNLILDKIEFKEIDMNIDVLTEKEAAQLYKISKRTLSNLRKENKIPYKTVWFYIGRQIRYKAQPLQNYFESNTTSY